MTSNQKYRNRMGLFVGAVAMAAWQVGVQVINHRKRKRKEKRTTEKPKRVKVNE